MSIDFACPGCGKKFSFPRELRGTKVRCKQCQAPFVIGGDRVEVKGETRIQDQRRPAPVPTVPAAVDEEVDAPSRPAVKSRRGNGALIAILLVGALGLVAIVVAVGVGSIAWFALRSSGPSQSATVAAASGGAEADLPNATDAPVLRYRWRGAPHVYHVRVEVDQADHVELSESNFVVQVGAGGPRQPIANAERKGAATGFVVDPNGWLVTCSHVVADASKVDVVLGGRTYPAKVVARHGGADLAVLRIEARDLPTLALGESDAAEVGQEVWALGYPLSNVLGNNLKATRGTLSGVNLKNGGKEFQIDASVNPGNSGGPLVNDRGQVLGVTKSKLAGAAISNVGFATPSNDTRRWLTSQRVPFTTGGWEEKLDGPTLVKRVSAATALIQVTLDPNAAGDVNVLTCHGALPTIKLPKPGQMFIPGFPDFPRFENSRVEADSFGRIQHAAGGIQMPYLLGDVVGFLIDPLPEDGRVNWESSSRCTIEEGAGGGSRSRFGLPGGFGPPAGFPGPRFGPPGFPGMGGRDNDRQANTRTGEERCIYTRIGAEGDLIRIQKDYELKVPPAGASGSSLAVNGRAIITFDAKQGLPRTIEFSGSFEMTAKRTTVKVPVTVEYKLVDGDEREKILHPPPPPPEKPKEKAPNETETPPAVTNMFAAGPRVFVSDLNEFAVKNGPWPVSKQGELGNGTDKVRVNGVESPHGLGMHPPDAPAFASAKYRLGKYAAVFKATVAINDSTKWCFSPAIFSVWGDGKQLFESKMIAHNHAHTQECSVDVSGVDILELRVRCVNMHPGAHAVWVEPRLLKQADTPDK